MDLYQDDGIGGMEEDLITHPELENSCKETSK